MSQRTNFEIKLLNILRVCPKLPSYRKSSSLPHPIISHCFSRRQKYYLNYKKKKQITQNLLSIFLYPKDQSRSISFIGTANRQLFTHSFMAHNSDDQHPSVPMAVQTITEMVPPESDLTNGHECERLVVVEWNDVDDAVQLLVIWGEFRVNMDRKKSEPLKDVLKRLSLSLKNRQQRSKTKGDVIRQTKKRKQETEPPETSTCDDVPILLGPIISGPNDILLISESGESLNVHPDMTCIEGLSSASTLMICGEPLRILRNLPRIVKMAVLNDVVVGYVISVWREL